MMIKLNFLIILNLISFFVIAKEEGCFDSISGKIKYTHNGNEVIKNMAYCFNSSRREIIQQKCTFDKNFCEATSKINNVMKIHQSNSEIGNPTFKVCHSLKGSPMIMSFWNGDQWIDSSFCIFSDMSFIDLSRLYAKQKVSFD